MHAIRYNQLSMKRANRPADGFDCRHTRGTPPVTGLDVTQFFRLFHKWKGEIKGRELAGDRFKANRTFVKLNDLFADPQSQSGTGHLVVHFRSDLLEPLENLFLLVFRDAGAMVSHFDARLFGRGNERYFNGISVVGKFRSIGDEIGHYL